MVPVVLAVVGYFIQKSLAEAGLKKDYVQIALSVLREPPSKDSEHMRLWAIAVLDTNSPVPLPAKLRAELADRKSFKFTVASLDDMKLGAPEVTISCKDAPDPKVVPWLAKTYPDRFTECANGQLGERTVTFPGLDKLRETSIPDSGASNAGKK